MNSRVFRRRSQNFSGYSLMTRLRTCLGTYLRDTLQRRVDLSDSIIGNKPDKHEANYDLRQAMQHKQPPVRAVQGNAA